MGLFNYHSILDPSKLSMGQVLKISAVRTWGKEAIVPKDANKDKLITREAWEAEGRIVRNVDTDDGHTPFATVWSVTAVRKIVYPVKLIEFASCFLRLAIDQLFLRAALRCDAFWKRITGANSYNPSSVDDIDFNESSETQQIKHEPRTKAAPPATYKNLAGGDEEEAEEPTGPAKKDSLGYLNPGVWLRFIVFLPLNLLDGIVRCIASPWNWVMRPIFIFIEQNWKKDSEFSDKAKVASMFILGFGIAAALIVGSILTGGILPLTMIVASWPLYAFIPALFGTFIASMVVSHRLITIFQDKDAEINNVFGDDDSEQNYGLMASTSESYYYFNTSLQNTASTYDGGVGYGSGDNRVHQIDDSEYWTTSGGGQPQPNGHTNGYSSAPVPYQREDDTDFTGDDETHYTRSNNHPPLSRTKGQSKEKLDDHVHYQASSGVLDRGPRQSKTQRHGGNPSNLLNNKPLHRESFLDVSDDESEDPGLSSSSSSQSHTDKSVPQPFRYQATTT